jgi:hypothetical protein
VPARRVSSVAMQEGSRTCLLGLPPAAGAVHGPVTVLHLFRRRAREQRQPPSRRDTHAPSLSSFRQRATAAHSDTSAAIDCVLARR